MTIRHFAFCLALLALTTLRSPGTDNTYVRFNTTLGNIDVQLLSDEAPNTVANFLSYVNSGAYSNSLFHRTATLQNDGVGCIQGGGFFVSGNNLEVITAGSPVNSEFSAAHPNVRGTLAMALTSAGPNSGTDEWFFNDVDNSAALDTSANSGPFTVFGNIANTSSLSVMDAISNVPIYDASSLFGASFSELPLINYVSGNSVELSNLVLVNSITVLTVQNFATWQSTNFTSTQLSMPTFIAPASTPFGDEVPNLMKYLYDINPSRPMTAADRAALPVLGSTTISGTKYITLTFREYAQLIDASLNVQTSPDLQTWTTLTTQTNLTIVQTGTDSVTHDPIMQIQVAATGSNQFLRLNVTQP